MKRFEHIINSKFQEFFIGKKNPENHLYFESFEWWQDLVKKFKIHLNVDKKIEEDKYNPIIIKKLNQTTFFPQKIASAKFLENIYSFCIIKNRNTQYFYQIEEELKKLENYNLPSTITNLKNEYPRDKTNILIIGAGPIGLFTSIYLNKLYKNKINLLLVDNRIKEEGIRLPYTRVTNFSIDLEELKFFFSKIFCLDFYHNISKNSRHFLYINILENLLYVYAYHHKIPIYFTKKLETFKDVKRYAIENNFKYILDCTGGRLKAKFQINKDIKWDSYKFKKDRYEIKYVGENLYKYYVDGKEYKHITVVLHLYDKNKREYRIGNLFGDINNESDEQLINQYQNILMTNLDFIQLAAHIKDFNLRNLYYFIIQTQKNFGLEIDPKYVKITTFITCSRHVKQAAKLLNKELMYIGMGDTLGASEYGIYFGLNAEIQFSKFICNLIPIVKYLEN